MHTTKNPVEHVETGSKTNYKAILVTPAQTLSIIEKLPNPLHNALVCTTAATARTFPQAMTFGVPPLPCMSVSLALSSLTTGVENAQEKSGLPKPWKPQKTHTLRQGTLGISS